MSTLSPERWQAASRYLQGRPITEFCDEQRLTIRHRIELFIPVCMAVQHAHVKGIIHRDIKLGNVLVAISDQRPAPKVIDFGIAKAFDQRQEAYGELDRGLASRMSPSAE